MKEQLYLEIMDDYKKTFVIGSIEKLLIWDSRVNLPSTAINIRGEQRALINLYYRKELIAINNKLEKIKIDDLTGKEKKNIEILQQIANFELSVPDSLAEEYRKQILKSNFSWRKAKESNNFSLFQEDLKETIDIVRKTTEYINPQKEPFNVLLEYNEPGLTKSKVLTYFSEFTKEIKNFRLEVLGKNTKNYKELNELFDLDEKQQIKIANRIAELIQFNLEGGLISNTTHPFSIGIPKDVRLAIRKSGPSAVFGTLHEGGHSVYTQNALMNYEPIDEPRSAGLHESQSRFYETIIGRSKPFWSFFKTDLQKITGKNYELDQLYKSINVVSNQPIRVQADELSYIFHIILRTEIEPKLLNEELSVKELSDYWNERTYELLEYKVKNDSEGILQDVHWSSGNYGYFPTYALGNMYAGQFYYAMNKKFNVYNEIEKGNFKTIKEWLNENIHKEGSYLDPLDLIKKSTGEEFTPKYYIMYLKEKYGSLIES